MSHASKEGEIAPSKTCLRFLSGILSDVSTREVFGTCSYRVDKAQTTEGNLGTREICGPGKIGFTCENTVFGGNFDLDFDHENFIMRLIF